MERVVNGRVGGEVTVKHGSILHTPVPLELRHSWPLFEQPRHFELGLILDSTSVDSTMPARIGEIDLQHVGAWGCDLTDNSLTWSNGVYDIFGLARGSEVSRDDAVSFYREPSRAAMERLRARAIKHRRGFTIDVEIRPAGGEHRWVRLIAAPVCDGDRAVRLHGLKLAL